MGSVKIWAPLFAILAYVISVTYSLTTRQFLFLLAVGLAVMFVIVGLTHSDEVPAEEAAEQGADAVQETYGNLKDAWSEEDDTNESTIPLIDTTPMSTIQFTTILVDAYNTFVLEDGTVNQELFALLETYPNHKVIMTNANDEEMEKFGITDMPYDVFTLKHKPNKTDPIYYTTMLETLGLEADRVIYFEHNIQSVASAQSVGITSYHYDKDAKDLVSLKAFLDAHL